jgi:hypothetical protein
MYFFLHRGEVICRKGDYIDIFGIVVLGKLRVGK